MSIETISYIATFILTAGISALGIMLSIQLYQQFKKPVLAALLYQQIFLYSFLIYSIWGNIILKTVLNDIQMSASLSAKLAVFVPMIGIPFMMVSWFMLLKVALGLRGMDNMKSLGWLFFPTLVVLILAIDFLIYHEKIPIPKNADLFIVRILTFINLLIYIAFTLVFFLVPVKKKVSSEAGFGRKAAFLLLAAVMASSISMIFFNQFGFISINISVLLAFATAAFLPVYINFRHAFTDNVQDLNFEAFCELYEISKREAEIVQLICNGLSNKAIADKLFITLQTVKDHNHRIFMKTAVKSRVQLTNLVLEKTGEKV